MTPVCAWAEGLAPADPGASPPLAASRQSGILAKAQALHAKVKAAGFYPTVRALAEGTGIGPGLTFWKPRPFGGPVGFLATVGWSPRVALAEVRLGRVPARPHRIPDRRFALDALTADPTGGANHRKFLFLEARTLHVRRNRLYFSAGPEGAPEPAPSPLPALQQTPDPEKIPFDARESDADLVAGYHFFRGLAAAVRVGYVRARTRFDAGALAEMEAWPAIPGANETTDFARATFDLVFDRRDQRNRARRGAMVHLRWLGMEQQGGELYNFDRLELDGRAFLCDRSRRHVLAARFSGTWDAPAPGTVVPFYFQEALGGSHTLRSFPYFRFRGTRLLSFSAEYRVGLLPWLEAAAFYDGGKVSGGVGALGSAGYRDSLGVSLRWVTEDDVILRGYAAYGGEGWRLSASGSFPF